MAGRIGVRRLDEEQFAGCPVKIAATVPRSEEERLPWDDSAVLCPDWLPWTFSVRDWIPRADLRNQSVDFVAMAVSSALQAGIHSGLLRQPKDTGDIASIGSEEADWLHNVDRSRVGTSVSSGVGGLQESYDASVMVHEGRSRRISPFYVPRMLPNMAAGAVSQRLGLQGPLLAPATACAAGLHAIGESFRLIKYGDADVMFAGGSEASVHPLALTGFARLRALSTAFEGEPQAASRPFDRQRDGFVLGEGSAVLVLEEREHAIDRGANIIGEVLGFGMSGDAHHITAPPEDGSGAARAMRSALREAGRSLGGTDGVQYVNAHATSTPRGDEVELRALQTLLAEQAGAPLERPVLVSSTKGATGHLLGAAGAMEAAVTALACAHNVAPPTVNMSDPIPTPDGVALVGFGKPEPITAAGQPVAITNSFGFGGTNASLVLGSAQR